MAGKLYCFQVCTETNDWTWDSYIRGVLMEEFTKLWVKSDEGNTASLESLRFYLSVQRQHLLLSLEHMFQNSSNTLPTCHLFQWKLTEKVIQIEIKAGLPPSVAFLPCIIWRKRQNKCLKSSLSDRFQNSCFPTTTSQNAG